MVPRNRWGLAWLLASQWPPNNCHLNQCRYSKNMPKSKKHKRHTSKNLGRLKVVLNGRRLRRHPLNLNHWPKTVISYSCREMFRICNKIDKQETTSRLIRTTNRQNRQKMKKKRLIISLFLTQGFPESSIGQRSHQLLLFITRDTKNANFNLVSKKVV